MQVQKRRNSPMPKAARRSTRCNGICAGFAVVAIVRPRDARTEYAMRAEELRNGTVPGESPRGQSFRENWDSTASCAEGPAWQGPKEFLLRQDSENGRGRASARSHPRTGGDRGSVPNASERVRLRPRSGWHTGAPAVSGD